MQEKFEQNEFIKNYANFTHSAGKNWHKSVEISIIKANLNH